MVLIFYCRLRDYEIVILQVFQCLQGVHRSIIKKGLQLTDHLNVMGYIILTVRQQPEDPVIRIILQDLYMTADMGILPIAGSDRSVRIILIRGQLEE